MATVPILLKKFQKLKLYPGDKPGVQGGEVVSALAAAQAFKGLRTFFLRVGGLFAKGKRFGQITDDKKLENIVKKFSKTEATLYQKTLTKIGFPALTLVRGRVLGFVRKATKVGKETAKKLKRAKAPQIVAETKLQNAIEQHINFLKEESFFQKAHKEAKQLNLITRDERTRAFYHDYAAEYGVNYRSLQMLRTGGRRVSDIKLGRMYFFRYGIESTASGRAVKRKTIYDAFPLIFLLSETPETLEGINFHYITPKLRIILLGKMFMYLNNQNFTDRTKLFARKFRTIIQENRMFRHAKASYKSYKSGRIRSKIIQVHPMDWELAITVPTERFLTSTGGRVPSKKIWLQTKKLARTV